MGKKYEAITAKDIKERGINTSEDIQKYYEKESQLDRIEKKTDRILELLENGDLSTTVKLDAEKIANIIYPAVIDQ